MISVFVQLFGKFLSPVAQQFNQALMNPKAAQRAVQLELINGLIQTEYGKFYNINGVEDWHRLPIVDYPEIESWIHRQQNSHAHLITPHPILFYETTSGSTGSNKLIPYTPALKSSFNRMFCIWAYDLIKNGPKFSTGQVYMCISPTFAREGDSKIKGFEKNLKDDSEYLNWGLKLVLKPFLVALNGLGSARNAMEFKHQLAINLILAQRLEIISIWSPSFLITILNYIQENREILCQKLQTRLSLKRVQILSSQRIDWEKLWPHLKLISCWNSAMAADSAKHLNSYFPTVMVQGKGLLATEAPLTIPLIAAQGYIPVLQEVFFEFEDSQGQIYHLDQIQTGKVYSMIVSQKGGLYRYRIGDRVSVSHFYQHTPCLEFLGRTQTTTDLVGEKLHCDFVAAVLASLSLQAATFKTLIPVRQPMPHYLLLLDQTSQSVEEIAQQLDQALMQSYHYRYARQLGQLAPVTVQVSSQIPEILATQRLTSGTRWGDVKFPLLTLNPWETETELISLN
ncbi:MAG: GH3 family domain-containing protein [Microcoleaceae cyanobacterium]